VFLWDPTTQLALKQGFNIKTSINELTKYIEPLGTSLRAIDLLGFTKETERRRTLHSRYRASLEIPFK
jgi:hypothetical protein